jgi:hypothetical protein
VRVAAMGESTSMILRVPAPPCNAPTGLNETINLYDQLRVYLLLPSATRCYQFFQLRGAVVLER